MFPVFTKPDKQADAEQYEGDTQDLAHVEVDLVDQVVLKIRLDEFQVFYKETGGEDRDQEPGEDHPVLKFMSVSPDSPEQEDKDDKVT